MVNKSLLNIYVLTSIYFILSFIGILNHEIWLDEAHHWLMSKDSVSYQDLIYNYRYEGQPRMWSLLLYIISRFTHNPFWMQFIQVIISTLTVFIFLKKAPFSWIFKTIFIFGYFMFFEYNLLARNYMLGVLFLFLAMGLYEKRNEYFLLFSLYLVLSSNVHLIFLVLSSALFFSVMIEHYNEKKILKKKYVFGYTLFLFGVIFSIIQIIPASDTAFFDSINNLSIFKRLQKGFISVWKGLILLPDFRTINFWNTNILINISKPIAVMLGLLIYFIPLIIFYKNKRVLFYVYLSILGAQLFFYVTQRGTTRSDGMIYLTLIIGLWIEKYSNSNPFSLITKKISNETLLKLKNFLVFSILCIHLFSGIMAYSIDLNYSFTPAKQVADFIKKNDYQKKVIISPYCDTPISSYTDKNFFLLCTNSFQSFCHWNLKCITDDKSTILMSFMEKQKNSCIYITIDSIFEEESLKKNKTKIEENIEIRLLKSINKSILRNRDYYIYEMKNKKIVN